MSGRPIIEPRLSFWPVLRRGLCYGLGAIIVLMAGSLLGDHQDSLTLVAVVSGPTLIIGLICAVFGPFFWWCSRRRHQTVARLAQLYRSIRLGEYVRAHLRTTTRRLFDFGPRWVALLPAHRLIAAPLAP